MIIQCEQCQTKFKLDDSKVPDKGVKVRCARCRHVFTVAGKQPDSEPQSDFGSMLESAELSRQEAAEVQPEFMEPVDSSAIDFEDDTLPPYSISGDPEQIEVSPAEKQEDQEELFPSEISSADQSLESSEEDLFPTDISNSDQRLESLEGDLFPADFDSSDQTMALEEEDSLFPPVQVEPQTPLEEVDFGEFDFSIDDDDAAPEVPADLDFGDAPKIQPSLNESQQDDFGGLDFSGDDMFGEVVPSAPEETDGTVAFDFGMDDFASSMGVNDTVGGQKNAFSMSEASSDTPFSLDDIDFGDELTSVGVHHVNPEELKPSQELLFAPLAEAQSKPQPDSGFNTIRKGTAEEELPPLPIASRRKQSPFLTVMLAALGIILVTAVAFFGYSMFAGDKSNTAQESGRITLSDVEATFVKNKLTGDLLVISGEAVNEFSKPRAAIQIKGMVYGAKGEVLASKNAFCGNPLTEEQLSTMSLDKIEAAMANQFGDSLANMEVAPGKAIPFVIVIAKPPEGAKDYGVEPAGSTVATGKSQ